MIKQRRPLVLKAVLWVTWCCVIPCMSVTSSTDGPLSQTDRYPYNKQLDDNYSLAWKFNSSHILFHIQVKTKGWVGFGISPNGKMSPGDMFIAWKSDQTVHFHDRHATGKVMPVIDKQQDWNLLDMKKDDDLYTLTVMRKLNTCDDEDLPIESGTTRVIYAYNDAVPTSDNSIPYHGPKSRGTKSILLLDPPLSSRQVKMPSDVTTMDIVQNKYKVPGTDTTYVCSLVKLPKQLKEKHHLIKIDPVIQKGHEGLVHHMLIYACNKPIPDDVLNTHYMCYQNEPKVAAGACLYTLVAWAIGGKGFTFPSNAGQSMGAANDPVYFKLEIHYDNQQLKSDYVDNSGFRLFLTKQLREHDAGTLLVGAKNDKTLIVPPHYESFLTRSHIPTECIDKSLGDKEIRVFADLLHSHLMSRKMSTRHIRDGVELPPIVKDDHYDFDFQETRILEEERVIKKGDVLMTECRYDSTDRTTISYGGFSSKEEMCLSFLLYYPKTSLDTIFTAISYTKDNKTMYPEGVQAYVNKTDWSIESNRREFMKNVQESDVVTSCFYSDGFDEIPSTRPEKFKEYIPEDTCQGSGGGNGWDQLTSLELL